MGTIEETAFYLKARYPVVLRESMEPIAVETFFGYKGEETPKSFTFNGVAHEVNQIIDHWYSQECSLFRVSADDGFHYVLRFHFETDCWELVMQESSKLK